MELKHEKQRGKKNGGAMGETSDRDSPSCVHKAEVKIC